MYSFSITQTVIPKKVHLLVTMLVLLSVITKAIMELDMKSQL